MLLLGVFLVLLGNAVAREVFDPAFETIDCENGLTVKSLARTNITYLCQGTLGLLVHSLRFEVSGFAGFLQSGTADSPHDWIEIEVGDHEETEELSGVPYTGCLSLEDGAKGSLQATISHTYGISASTNFKIALLNVLMAKLSHGIESTIGGSTTMTAEYVCIGSPEETVQIQLTRKFHVFRESRWRRLELKPHIKFVTISRGPWNIMSRLKGLVSSPVVRCVSDPKLLQCGKLL